MEHLAALEHEEVLIRRGRRSGLFTIVAVHSLVEEERTVRLESDGPLVDLFADDELKASRGRVAVPLGRYGARWFRVHRRGRRVAP